MRCSPSSCAWAAPGAQRRRLAVELAWREPVDALVLDHTPLPQVPQRERPVVLELLLRYRALLRGPEAARITDYLEAQGYVEEAVAGLRSRSRWKRATSAAQLGRMRSDAATAALVGLMDDESDDVRMVAARSLAAIGDPSAVQALTAALADPSRWTATTVAADLVEMGTPAVPTLIEIAAADASGDPGAHEAAVTAVRVLGEIRDPARRARAHRAAGETPTTSTCARGRPPRSEPSAAPRRRRRCGPRSATTRGRCAPRPHRVWVRSATAAASRR